MRRRLFAALMALALLVSLLPVSALAADEGVTYIDENGDEQTVTETVTPVTADDSVWTSGWYLVEGEVTVADRITVSGDVNLILADGFTLDAQAVINVPTGSSITIYAQSTGGDMGALRASGQNSGTQNGDAGIGGDHESVNFGAITINGGKVPSI